MKVKCKYDHKILRGDTSNGTSHLRNHKNVCFQKQIHDGSQKYLAVNFLPNGGIGKKELCSGQFNTEVYRKQLATMVVIHEYPLGMVITCTSKYYKMVCNPCLKFLIETPLRRIFLQCTKLRRNKSKG
ncbi:hypothetical protein LINGRAHAP2_LOCUS1783 [Linum grandiflorum]